VRERGLSRCGPREIPESAAAAAAVADLRQLMLALRAPRRTEVKNA